MKKRIWIVAALMGLIVSLPVMAEDPMTLEDIVISEKKLVRPTKQTNETVYTGSEVTRKKISLLSTP